jgi:hypothetical protein
LANKKTVAVQPAGEKDLAVVLSTTKTKKQNTPAKLGHKSVMRKDFRKMAKAVRNQVLATENNISLKFKAAVMLCMVMQSSSCYAR